MEYGQALSFIHNIARFGTKPGLRRIRLLLEKMGNPQDTLKFIHVAGTNGKGSTCTMLSHVLRQQGYKTGLFISPFVLDFRERIQINNEMISKEELIRSVDTVRRHWDELNTVGEPPTEFEVVTAAAMDYFQREKCEVVVLEVGMGGRFDATNIIRDPLCSVITSIDIDHTEYLGETLTEITVEKCGIIKENGRTVSYPNQAPPVAELIAKTCQERGNKLYIGIEAETSACGLTGSNIVYEGLSLRVPFGGEHQVLNAITVLETVKALRDAGLEIKDEAVVAGVEGAAFPARFERLGEKPYLILLDGAHNAAAAKVLAAAIKPLAGRRIHAVISFMADKNADGMLKELLPHCYSVTAYAMNTKRAMLISDIVKHSAKYCDRVFISGTLAGAVIQPLSRCQGDDVILIFGSLYFASEIRPVAQELLARFN